MRRDGESRPVSRPPFSATSHLAGMNSACSTVLLLCSPCDLSGAASEGSARFGSREPMENTVCRCESCGGMFPAGGLSSWRYHDQMIRTFGSPQVVNAGGAGEWLGFDVGACTISVHLIDGMVATAEVFAPSPS